MFSRLETFTAGAEILVPVLATHSFRFEGASTRRNPSLIGLGRRSRLGNSCEASVDYSLSSLIR